MTVSARPAFVGRLPRGVRGNLRAVDIKHALKGPQIPMSLPLSARADYKAAGHIGDRGSFFLRSRRVSSVSRHRTRRSLARPARASSPAKTSKLLRTLLHGHHQPAQSVLPVLFATLLHCCRATK